MGFLFPRTQLKFRAPLKPAALTAVRYRSLPAIQGSVQVGFESSFGHNNLIILPQDKTHWGEEYRDGGLSPEYPNRNAT